jgi:hypothetical protein
MIDLTRTEPISTAVATAAPPAKPAVRPSDLDAYRPERPSAAQSMLGLIGLTAIAVATLVVWEKFAPETWRPSHLIGTLAGTVVASEKNASMVAAAKELQLMSQEKARMDIEVKDAEARLAMATKGYEVQLEMQRLGYEAQVQRATDAYKALFNRGTTIANTATILASDLVKRRMDLAQGHQGGKVLASTIGDVMSLWGAATGDNELAVNGRRISTEATNSSLSEVDAAIARPLPDFRPETWARSLPDPAQLLVELEQMKTPVPGTTPQPPQRAVPPPAPYGAIKAIKE